MAGSADPTPEGSPGGSWLLVVGSHRSGTSATAGALGALGFAVPSEDDRVEWPESNPEHWESYSLSVFNEGLLSARGGSWDAPPDLIWNGVDGGADHGIEGTRGNPASDAEALLTAAFPHAGPAVWKDPRLSLLLPWWSRRLRPPAVAILVWRSPLAVARSLEQRDGMGIADGLALWERYNRSALEVLVGTDTYVCHYEVMLGDPEHFVASVADWLGGLDQFAEHASNWDRAGAADSLRSDLRHQVGGATRGDARILPEHEALVRLLTDLEGGHRPLTVVPGVESSWTTGLLDHRKKIRSLSEQLVVRQGEVDALHDRLGEFNADVEAARAERDVAQAELHAVRAELERERRRVSDIYASRSWRFTRPVRSLQQKLAPGTDPPSGPGR